MIDHNQTPKIRCMTEDPTLFKKYIKAVRRAKYLYAGVFLCDDCVELTLLTLDKTDVSSGNSAIESVIRFHNYDQNDLKSLNAMLDKRAETMKRRWLPSYQKLYDSESSGWSLDLTKMDYAVLIDGDSICSSKRYHMSWSFEGVKGLMDYIADCMMPDLEEDDD